MPHNHHLYTHREGRRETSNEELDLSCTTSTSQLDIMIVPPASVCQICKTNVTLKVTFIIVEITVEILRDVCWKKAIAKKK